MPAHKGIRLPAKVLEEVKDAISLFELNQRKIGAMIHCSQPLVSTMLAGTPVSLEIITNLASGLENLARKNLADGKIDNTQVERIYELSKKLCEPPSHVIIPPGHPIPRSAQNFVNRPEIEEVLNCLEWYNGSQTGQYPFSLVVESPADSGKTTLLHILAEEAQKRKIPVSTFDCSVAATAKSSDRGLAESESLFFRLLTSQLSHDFNTEATHNASSTTHVSSFMAYLDKLQHSPRQKSPLLVVDNVTALDCRIALALLSVVKDYTSNYSLVSNRSASINFALGFSTFNPETYRTIHDAEINETARVSLGWFNFKQVGAMLKQLGGDELLTHQGILWKQYSGQPVLTHLAATELMKREAAAPSVHQAMDGDDTGIDATHNILRVGYSTPEAVYQMALSGEGRFGRHIKKLETSLKGRGTGLLFQIMEHPDVTGYPMNEDVRYFLDAHLVTKTETVGTRYHLEAASRYYKELLNSRRTDDAKG